MAMHKKDRELQFECHNTTKIETLLKFNGDFGVTLNSNNSNITEMPT